MLLLNFDSFIKLFKDLVVVYIEFEILNINLILRMNTVIYSKENERKIGKLIEENFHVHKYDVENVGGQEFRDLITELLTALKVMGPCGFGNITGPNYL